MLFSYFIITYLCAKASIVDKQTFPGLSKKIPYPHSTQNEHLRPFMNICPYSDKILLRPDIIPYRSGRNFNFPALAAVGPPLMLNFD